jgi:hypothetical protein
MISVPTVLSVSNLSWPFTQWHHNGVVITPANQLIASYRDLNIERA